MRKYRLFLAGLKLDLLGQKSFARQFKAALALYSLRHCYDRKIL